MVGEYLSRDNARYRGACGFTRQTDRLPNLPEVAQALGHNGNLRACCGHRRLFPSRPRYGVLRYGHPKTDTSHLLCRPLGSRNVISNRDDRRDHSLHYGLAQPKATELITRLGRVSTVRSVQVVGKRGHRKLRSLRVNVTTHKSLTHLSMEWIAYKRLDATDEPNAVSHWD